MLLKYEFKVAPTNFIQQRPSSQSGGQAPDAEARYTSPSNKHNKTSE
jgi:hypothetical protein